MKKIVYLMTLGIIVVLLSGCASYSKSGAVAPVYAYVSPTKEIKADINVDNTQMIEGKAHQWYLAGIRVTGGNKYFENLSEQPSVLGRRTSKAQSCAMYNAVTNGNYDMLVSPQYTSVIHSFLFGLIKRYDVTVKGYGAKINGVYQ
jgi:hypothetical protein